MWYAVRFVSVPVVAVRWLAVGWLANSAVPLSRCRPRVCTVVFVVLLGIKLSKTRLVPTV
jgi:hypothetical protein